MDEHHLFNWLLSFGCQAELLEPREARKHFEGIIHAMEEKYRRSTGDRR